VSREVGKCLRTDAGPKLTYASRNGVGVIFQFRWCLNGSRVEACCFPEATKVLALTPDDGGHDAPEFGSDRFGLGEEGVLEFGGAMQEFLFPGVEP